MAGGMMMILGDVVQDGCVVGVCLLEQFIGSV